MLPFENISWLYNECDLFALPTRGEGFGLPIFEAAYSGLPVVATGWSGQMDFLVDEDKSEHFYNVSFDLQPVQKEVVWENVLIAESMWAFPREQSAKQKMRQCYEDIINNTDDTFATNASEYAIQLCDRFSAEKMYADFCDGIVPEKEIQAYEKEIDDLLSDLL